MKTNFFELIQNLQLTGNLTISIQCGTDPLSLSVCLKNDDVSDKAKNIIPTLNLSGSAQELDEAFFSTITKPLQKTSGLMVNMQQYEKAQEEARKASRGEQDKKDKLKKEEDEKNKKFEAQMKKVTELEKENKFREAYAQLPKPEDYPEHAEKLNEKKQFLMEKFEQPSLF
jgi:PRTRC genetic system protein E